MENNYQKAFVKPSLLIGVLVIAVIVGAGLGFYRYTKSTANKSQEKIEELEQQIRLLEQRQTTATPTPFVRYRQTQPPREDSLVKVERCKAAAEVSTRDDIAELYVSLNKAILPDISFEEKLDLMKFNAELARGMHDKYFDQYYLICLNK